MSMKIFVDYLNRKFLAWQNDQGKPKKAKEFAEFIGITPSTYSSWMNAGAIPSM